MTDSEARIYRRIGIVAGLLVTMLLLGTVGFVFISGYPWFDAFYMTVITITTVGYGEIRPLDQTGRLFNSFLLLFGVSVMFYGVGAITQTVLETQFSDLFGKRRIRKMIDQLSDHYILCGFGRVGRAAAHELLRSREKFVVVDNNDDRVEWAIKQGMIAFNADSTRDETLEDLGIRRARGLIAALATDADNLFLILSAKALNPHLRVATRVADEGSESKLRRAGADSIFMPYSITGYRLAQSVLRPHVFEFLEITSRTSSLGMNIGIEEVEVRENSALVGKALKDLQLPRDPGLIVLAIRTRDGNMLFNPPADTVVDAGSHLIVMGEPEGVRKVATR